METRLEELNTLLVDTFDAILRVEGKSLKQVGKGELSIAEFHTLECIGRGEDCRRAVGEIAEALGVSYTTILKLIGKQPASVRKERQLVEPSKAVRSIEDDRPAALIVAERTYHLQGELGKYDVNCAAETICLRLPEQTPITLTYAKAASLHAELSAILLHADQTRFTFEAW